MDMDITSDLNNEAKKEESQFHRMKRMEDILWECTKQASQLIDLLSVIVA